MEPPLCIEVSAITVLTTNVMYMYMYMQIVSIIQVHVTYLIPVLADDLPFLGTTPIRQHLQGTNSM